MIENAPIAKIQWYRTPVDKQVMAELLEPSDWKGLRQAGGHYLLVLLTGTLTFLVWQHYSFWYALPLLVLHNNVLSMLHAGVHELIHERVFKTPFLNRCFLEVSSFLTWWNHPFFHYSHKEHHRYTCNNPLDQEVILPQGFDWKSALLKPLYGDPKGIWWNLKKHWGLARGRHPAYFAGGEAWTEKITTRLDPKEQKAIAHNSAILLGGHLAIAIASFATGYWIFFFLITLAPYLFNYVPLITGTPQHIGLMREVQDFRLNCRTYRSNFLFEFLYWNMNFHIEHHMYAAVPCYNLPRLHEVIKHDLPYCHDNVFDVWVEILHAVKRRSIDPDYDYRQPFPGEKSGTEQTLPESNASKVVQRSLSTEELAQYKVWECTICAFIYDEAYGLPEEGIAAGTRWEDIPEDWACPDCGVAKADFDMVERSRVSARQPAAEAKTQKDPIVLVGSGIAGYSLAAEYRKYNPEQELLILTRDKGESYSKPALSNALSLGKTAEQIVGKTAEAMARELKATIHTQINITRIDRKQKVIHTDASDSKLREIRYSQLVLATGAAPIELPIAGSGADRVRRVNDLEDYRHFREQLKPGARVTLIGAGLIGCEFANDLISQGYRVQVVDLGKTPMSTFLPEEAGRYLERELAKAGVSWKLENAVERIEQDGDELVCHLRSGEALRCELVLSAVGLKARTELAEVAGLKTAQGIEVDAFGRTCDPAIYALGDCAQLGEQVRPFILPIRHSVVAIAQSLNGQATKIDFPEMPVTVKTPSCPLRFLAPPPDSEGEWQLNEDEHGLRGRYCNRDGTTLGHFEFRKRSKAAGLQAVEA